MIDTARGYVTSMTNQLDAEDRNSLPESTFAFPRERKAPLTDASHVRNAIARFDQVQDVSDRERDEAFRRIKRAASKFGVEMTEKSWRELGKPTATKKSSDKPRTPTKAELSSAPSKKELYDEAQRRGVEGRSTRTKAELGPALRNR